MHQVRRKTRILKTQTNHFFVFSFLGELGALGALGGSIVFLFFLLFLFSSAPALAQETPGVVDAPVTNNGVIKKNIQKNKKDLAAVKKKILEEQKKQRLAQVKEKNVLSRLQRVDQKLGSLRKEKEANEQALTETRGQIDQLQGEMKQNQGQLAQSRSLLEDRLRALYRMSARKPLLGGLLDSESFADFARKLKFELTLARSNEKLLSETLLHEQKLERDTKLWSTEENRKKRIVGVLGKQEKNYSRERQNKTVFLSTIRQKQASREQIIAELSEQKEELQSKFTFLQKQVEESSKKPAYVPAGKGLMVKRGKIPWPVSGEIIPGYQFGRSKNKEFNAVVDNSGIQIKAPMGTPIQAVAGGLVRFADWFKGYGKLVILDHGEGYYSLYAQASELNVTEGQTVASGQVIGRVGDTGSLVGSSLYFEIRKNGVPQDPLRWLKHGI